MISFKSKRHIAEWIQINGLKLFKDRCHDGLCHFNTFDLRMYAVGIYEDNCTDYFIQSTKSEIIQIHCTLTEYPFSIWENDEGLVFDNNVTIARNLTQWEDDGGAVAFDNNTSLASQKPPLRIKTENNDSAYIPMEETEDKSNVKYYNKLLKDALKANNLNQVRRALKLGADKANVTLDGMIAKDWAGLHCSIKIFLEL